MWVLHSEWHCSWLRYIILYSNIFCGNFAEIDPRCAHRNARLIRRKLHCILNRYHSAGGGDFEPNATWFVCTVGNCMLHKFMIIYSNWTIGVIIDYIMSCCFWELKSLPIYWMFTKNFVGKKHYGQPTTTYTPIVLINHELYPEWSGKRMKNRHVISVLETDYDRHSALMNLHFGMQFTL